MELIKYTHACVTLTSGDRKLVIDPGVFSEVSTALDGASAVLVTHEHPDHIDVDAMRAALERDDQLTLTAPTAVAAQFDAFGDRVTAAEPGQSLDVKGFSVRTYGGQHALIHPRVPMIANIGYLVDAVVFHPGDSFVVPDVVPSILLVPVSAPWAKLSEVIDYVIALRAPRAVGIHEAIYSGAGLGIVRSIVTRFATEVGTDFSLLDPGTTVDV